MLWHWPPISIKAKSVSPAWGPWYPVCIISILSRRNHAWRDFSALQSNPSVVGGQEKKYLGWDRPVLSETSCVCDCCPSYPSQINPTMENMGLWAVCWSLNWYWQLRGGLPPLFHQSFCRRHSVKQKQISSVPVWDHSPLTINNKLEKSIPIWAPSCTHISPSSPIKKMSVSMQNSTGSTPMAIPGLPSRWWGWVVPIWQSWLTQRAVVRVGFSLNMSRCEM